MGQQISAALSESFRSVLVKLVSFLPGILALVLAVAILAGLGALFAWGLRRGLTAARFDERFSRNQAPNMADWAPAHSPTLLIARTVFWACVVLGCIIGISAFDASYPGNSGMSILLIPYLTHWIGAILILLVGSVVARFLARSVLIGAVNLQMQYARFLSLGVKWLVLVLTAAMALEHIQVGGSIVALAFGILFGGIVLTLSLAIGLGSRDLVTRSLEGMEPRERTAAARETPFGSATIPITSANPPKPTETLRHF